MMMSRNITSSSSPTLAYFGQNKCSTSTKVILVVTVVFTVLAILRIYNTSSQDAHFKAYTSLASASLFLGIAGASNIGNRIFRTAVLQDAVRKDGCLERGIITLYRKCNSFTDFNPARAERAYRALDLIGFRPSLLKLEKPSRELEILELDSSHFEKTISAAGGKWEKRGTQFVIIPPDDQSSTAWKDFVKGIEKFHWRKENGFIVTSEHADSISDEHRRLFVYATNSQVIINLRRAGFYLGRKQSVLIYSPSGCGRSTGYASEGQHYVDTVAVYKARIDGRHAPQHVWVTASCGNCPMIVHLKRSLSQIPFNLILESSFSNLQTDFIDPQGCIVRSFSRLHWNALSSPFPSQQVFETRYNLEKLVSNCRLAGKVVIVTVANDQRLSPSVAEKMVTIFQRACKNVHHVKFHAHEGNPHSARYFFYPDATREILNYVFN